jgi:hypothetical protein
MIRVQVSLTWQKFLIYTYSYLLCVISREMKKNWVNAISSYMTIHEKTANTELIDTCITDKIISALNVFIVSVIHMTSLNFKLY